MLINPTKSSSIIQRVCLNKPLWLIGLGFFVLYFILAKLGLTFTVISKNVTLIWPPSGLALFVLLIFGRRFWPWITLASFVTNLSTGISFFACLGIATGNTLEAVAGLYLLQRLDFDNRLNRVHDILSLALFAAGFSTMVGATLGSLSLTSFGIIPWSDYPRAWLSWWMGDAMGVLAFTPLFLSWWFKYPKRITRRFILEAVILLLSVIVITEFVFGFQFLLFEQPLPLEYMTFPSLIWASMRFGLRGTTTTTLIIGGIILMNIIFGIGPFVTGNILQSMTLLWLYTNFLAITSMILTTEIEERRKAERGMRHMAEHDHLTHLPNRRALVDSIGQAITHANESGDIFAVLFLDIDRFKIVNDSLGHSTGDQMLTIVSLRLLQCVRQDDVVSRLGGDEFVILLQGIKHVDDIYKVCNSILNSMHKPIYIENHELHSSVSIGVCLYPNDGENAEALLKHADIAMYRAKDVGRNNFKFYAPEMNQNVDARLAIENELRYALGKKEFLLHYQPQYHVLDGRIKGAEALLRWCKKDEMCVGPDIFIPVLEETGQIKEVGAWVIEEACRQLSEWNKCGWDHLRMSVNVSSYQLSDVQLPEKIAASLKRYQIDPMNLELEITESMLVRQDDIVEDVIQRLVALGVRMAVDDFGTGYSSLSYLHRLSIDTLKVDRSFVEKIPGNANSEAIAKAIVGLAKSLQLEVVAEGVERQEQCDFISLLGCDYVQGFLLSKPVSAKDFTRLLEKDSDSTLKFAR